DGYRDDLCPWPGPLSKSAADRHTLVGRGMAYLFRLWTVLSHWDPQRWADSSWSSLQCQLSRPRLDYRRRVRHRSQRFHDPGGNRDLGLCLLVSKPQDRRQDSKARKPRSRNGNELGRNAAVGETSSQPLNSSTFLLPHHILVIPTIDQGLDLAT